MAEFPIMQVMTDAYLGDTTHLTTTEHGAYFLLLMAMWRSGGSLPLDDKFIARTAGLSSTQWKRMRATIMGFMQVISADRFTQPKLLESFHAVRRHSALQSDRARSRWLKKKGLPDAAALIRQSRGNANQISKRSSTYLVQSMLPREEKKEGPPEEAEQVARPEPLEITSALRGSRLLRKAS